MPSFTPERFDLIRTLHFGPRSRTLLVNDRLLDRENVILKFIRKDSCRLDRNQLIEMFCSLINVQPDPFASVLDGGLTKNKDLYYVREYLPPSDLFSTNPVAILKRLVLAVDFLRQFGWVHGSIKPSNIFATKDKVRLADPALLERTSYDADALHFTAPEVLQGAAATHQGDLYSLGAVLYRVLTGRHLFEDPDVSRLRAKYLSASLPTLPYLSTSLHPISELVLGLLSRNTGERAKAFDRLKGEIHSHEAPSLSLRNPVFVGRKDLLQQAVQALQKPPNTLRVLLIEGEVGSGKSRFIEETRLQCSFRGLTFITWKCNPNSDLLMPVRAGLPKLVRSGVILSRTALKFGAKIPCETRSDETLPFPVTCEGYTLQETINQGIGVIAAFARRIPSVLTIENFEFADAGTTLFLEQLTFRRHELPLTLVLTRRPSEVEARWMQTLTESFGADFLRLRLPPLSEIESDLMVQRLETDEERQAYIKECSDGNPLFLENYATWRGTAPNQVANASKAMLSGVTSDTRALLKVLSVFRKPVEITVLAALCEKSLQIVNSKLDTASNLGLVKRDFETAKIRFPILQRQLYGSISKEVRVRLNRAAYFALESRESQLETLGHYAVEGEMFVHAVNLYRDLAERAWQSQEYRTALSHYDRLQYCCAKSGERLTTSETLRFAHCCSITGKHHVSDLLFKDLLSTSEVQRNPEWLSTVYTQLARTTDRISDKERARLVELAIECLPDRESRINRYPVICNFLLRLGDLNRAQHLLRELEEFIVDDNNKQIALLNSGYGSLLLSMGYYRRAIEYYVQPHPHTVDQSGVLNNLAFCFENLGELTIALDYQQRAMECGVKKGNLFVQVLSLNNIASIRMKRGEIRTSESLLKRAREGAKSLVAGYVRWTDSLRMTLEADSAICAIYRGKYDVAFICIKNIRRGPGLDFNIDRTLCEFTRCKFFLAIGLTRKVFEMLRKFEDVSIFSIDFLKVERALIEAQLCEIPATDRVEHLRQALALSLELGTLYQQCELLISLSTVQVELNQPQGAIEDLKKALDLADKNGYRLLTARGLLLLGIAAETASDRLQSLSDALELASEIGLHELIAEATYHIGIQNLESGNTITAREYLIRSTSMTAHLAEGVPAMARSRYLSKKWRRDALSALARCNESIPLHQFAMLNTDGDRYFAATYQFTMAAAAANSVEVLLASIERALATSLGRSAVITLKDETNSYSIPLRLKLTPELLQRAELIRSQAKNCIYFDSAEGKSKHVSAWIPLNSETCEGGIYVVYRSHESPPTEKDMELLTMLGTIASSALRRLESAHAHRTEPQELSEFHGLIGASKPMKAIYSDIQIAAGNAATVLIEGESGTGKELVAKAIHAAGPRGKAPFIAVDCGAIPEALIETELFGAKRGAYTGAVADRAGLFESAHCGTIFLDEISNTTAALQSKLLRVIQEREVRRIGDTKGRSIDVRLIVASNQSLEKLTEEGKFRKDLLYRLKVLHILLPPLRDRLDDIPLLAHAFLQKLNTSNKTRKCFAPGVIQHLSSQRFPGNVRELQNTIERAFFSTHGVMITEVPFDSSPTDLGHPAPLVEIQNWFKDISEGRKDFWSAIYKRYKRRDIPREKVVAFVDFGLRSTRGNYKSMASVFRMQEKDYRRFMDFLRRNDCLLDFRPYRKAASREN